MTAINFNTNSKLNAHQNGERTPGFSNEQKRHRKISLPVNIERAKRFSKELKRFAPNKKLSDCQEATAKMYGFDSWHSLTNSQLDSGGGSVKMDEDLTETLQTARAEMQADVIALLIFGLEPNVKYVSPKRPAGEQAYKMDPYQMASCNAANKRFQQLLCEMLVFEIGPSRTKELQMVAVEDDVLGAPDQEAMKDFPKLLAKWLRTQMPNVTHLAEDIESLYWNKDRPTAVLQMLACVGTMGSFYENLLGKRMIIGLANMLGRQFVAAVLQNSYLMAGKGEAQPDWTDEQLLQSLAEQRSSLMSKALTCFAWEEIMEYKLDAPEYNADAEHATRNAMLKLWYQT